MQKQFAKLFTKYFDSINKAKQKVDKEIQKNREKENIEKKKRQYMQEKR